MKGTVRWMAQCEAQKETGPIEAEGPESAWANGFVCGAVWLAREIQNRVIQKHPECEGRFEDIAMAIRACLEMEDARP